MMGDEIKEYMISLGVGEKHTDSLISELKYKPECHWLFTKEMLDYIYNIMLRYDREQKLNELGI